jgi:nitrite reductase/ring-hydroxylating ferredoxin subunit
MKNISACSVEECKSLGKKVVIVDGQEILLIYSDGSYFAVDNFCPHAQTRLISGRVEDGTLTCSNHGTCFDLKTGAIRIDKIDEDLLEQLDVNNLPFGPLKTYPLHIENEMIIIELK